MSGDTGRANRPKVRIGATARIITDTARSIATCVSGQFRLQHETYVAAGTDYRLHPRVVQPASDCASAFWRDGCWNATRTVDIALGFVEPKAEPQAVNLVVL